LRKIKFVQSDEIARSFLKLGLGNFPFYHRESIRECQATVVPPRIQLTVWSQFVRCEWRHKNGNKIHSRMSNTPHTLNKKALCSFETSD